MLFNLYLNNIETVNFVLKKKNYLRDLNFE